MNQLATLNTESVEDLLQIRSWGKWARPHYIGQKVPGWVHEIISGWRESETTREYIPEINEEYALVLDGMIAKMSERTKKVLIGLYVYRIPITRLPKTLRISRYVIDREREAGLWYLYGALSH